MIIIDLELERITNLGMTPRFIEIGDGLYEELLEEQQETRIAAVPDSGQDTLTYADKEVTEYKGIKVYRAVGKPKDYLHIVT